MKIRIRFTKHGAVRYIGHLDVMRYFQKCIRRAGVNVSYTGGYSPHQVMTFASPLGVGMESEGEYMDIGIDDEHPDTATILNSLNEASVPGIRIKSVRILPEDAGNAMASVYASEYEIRFYDDKKELCPSRDALSEAIDNMLSSENCIYHKQTKKTSRDINLKEFIYDLRMSDEEETAIRMTINSSSADSIKPVFVMEYLFELSGIKFPENALRITRLDMFTQKESGELISLEEIGL